MIVNSSLSRHWKILKMQLARSFLRSATRETHDEIDEMYWSHQGFETQNSYHRLLQNMWVAYCTLGVPAVATLHEFGEVFPAYAFLNAIRADQLADTPSSPLPDTCLINESQAWGIGYALVGSCAGAKMMINSGQIKPHWKTGYLNAASQFASQGGVSEFFKNLDNAHPNLDDATLGALAVFDCLRAPLRTEVQPRFVYAQTPEFSQEAV